MSHSSIKYPHKSLTDKTNNIWLLNAPWAINALNKDPCPAVELKLTPYDLLKNQSIQSHSVKNSWHGKHRPKHGDCEAGDCSHGNDVLASGSVDVTKHLYQSWIRLYFIVWHCGTIKITYDLNLSIVIKVSFSDSNMESESCFVIEL